MSNHSSYTGRYTRSGYHSSLTHDEIATVRNMHVAGADLKSIAAAIGRPKSAVACYIPPDAHDSFALYARWQALMPELRAAMRKAGAQP